MKERIVVPAADESGLNAQLAEHFGRAPFFAVVDSNESGEVSDVKIVPNMGEHFGGRGHAHDRIVELQPNVIIAHGIGTLGLIGFQNAGIAVLRATVNTVKGVVTVYNRDELTELTEGCHDTCHQ